MSEKRIRCTVTRYSVVDDRVVETTTEEETGYEVHPHNGYLYLHNSEASAPASVLIDRARCGHGWTAQNGTPPARSECQAERWGRYACCPGGCEAGWGGRNYPRIEVSAEALLEVLT